MKINKQNREGIGKMPPAPKGSLPNDMNASTPNTATQPSATGGGNLRDHNGKVCTQPNTFNY